MNRLHLLSICLPWLLLCNDASASVIFSIGTNNGSTVEMEQEGGGRNNANFYWENGDYTGLTGLNGSGLNWTSGQEPLVSTATIQGEPAGFPRALTVGFNTTNVFFQIDASELQPSNRLLFLMDVQGGRVNTTHDLEFLINGNSFLTISDRNVSPGLISAVINPHALGITSGPAVLSYRRTGGDVTNSSNVVVPPGTPGSNAWIVWDQLTLTAIVPEPTSALSLLGLIGTLGAVYRRRRKVSA